MTASQRRPATEEMVDVKVTDAVRRVDAASDELLAVHDAVKHGCGIQAEFPWPHDWSADVVVDHLEAAHRGAAEAARLLSKLANPLAEA